MIIMTNLYDHHQQQQVEQTIWEGKRTYIMSICIFKCSLFKVIPLKKNCE